MNPAEVLDQAFAIVKEQHRNIDLPVSLPGPR